MFIRIKDMFIRISQCPRHSTGLILVCALCRSVYTLCISVSADTTLFIVRMTHLTLCGSSGPWDRPAHPPRLLFQSVCAVEEQKKQRKYEDSYSIRIVRCSVISVDINPTDGEGTIRPMAGRQSSVASRSNPYVLLSLVRFNKASSRSSNSELWISSGRNWPIVAAESIVHPLSITDSPTIDCSYTVSRTVVRHLCLKHELGSAKPH